MNKKRLATTELILRNNQRFSMISLKSCHLYFKALRDDAEYYFNSFRCACKKVLGESKKKKCIKNG